jgi:hypothetical protein
MIEPSTDEALNAFIAPSKAAEQIPLPKPDPRKANAQGDVSKANKL